MSQITNVQTIKAHESMKDVALEPERTNGHRLDSEPAQKELDKVREWWRQAQISQRENRAEQATDEAYYDGEQWTEEEIKVLQARLQAPLVFNVTKNTINWILGTERKSRIDYKVLPREKDDSKGAEAKTKLIKYTQDVNKSQYHRSRAFADAVKVGVGWVELGLRSDPEEEPLYTRYENWRNIWYDHLSVEPDMSDARYIFRAKWVDLDIAKAMFPERAVSLEIEAENTNRLYPYLPDDFSVIDPAADDAALDVDMVDAFGIGGMRQRVRIIECWYRKPDSVQVLRPEPRSGFGSLRGGIYNESDPLHSWVVKNGHASTYDAVRMVTYCCMFTGGTLLQLERTPYQHNRFPFVPIWCYRRGRDNAPYGVIRDLRDPQTDLNKRRSKALFRLSANRVIAEKGAVDNVRDAHAEVNRPDGWVTVNVDKRFEINKENDLAAQDVAMAQDDERFIQSISGVTDENLGKKTNAVSGKAIEARQQQGLTSSGAVFDNLYYAVQAAGEIQLSLIEQFYTEPKVIRILGDSGKMEFKEINTPNEEGIVEDDIAAAKADFLVSQQDYRETLRQAMFESLSELTQNLSQTMPEVALKLLDLVVDMSDLPNKDDLVARIREINGQKDPAAEQTPEEQQADEAQKAQAQALQQQVQELELAAKTAQVAKDEADAALKRATAVVKNVEALYSAMQTGQIAVTVPGVTPVADGIAKSAGYEDKDAGTIYPQSAAQPMVAPMPENTNPLYPANPGVGMMEGIQTPEGEI